MTWKTIFNPFGKFDERYVLIVGILFFVLNIFGCYYSGMINDSIFHYALQEGNQNMGDIAKTNSLSYAFAIVVLFILGIIINKRTRFIDIINTVLISQIFLQITTPVSGLPFFKESINNIAKNADDLQNLSFVSVALVSAWGFLTLILLIYSIVLYYNGFRTATNIKKWQQIVLFALVSLVLTIASQTIF